MKKALQFLSLALSFGLFVASCSPAPEKQSITISQDALKDNRGVMRVKMDGAAQALAQQDVITLSKDMAKAQAAADAQEVTNLRNTLMGAESKAQALDVKLTLAEETIQDGHFVFALEATESKNLVFEMYDEEGFETVGANKLDITSGKNYKAVSVKGLPDGNYVFRLKDAEGKELVQKLQIKQAN